MKVRNVQQYLKSYILDIPATLGGEQDPWLQKLYGIGTNVNQLVGTISSFAIKTNAQIFYEFLQNADDAEADRIHFVFDDNYLAVINNGKPFYTDTNGSKERKGQLLNFLAKNKSEKYDDPESVGKYGQGSKLMYDLLIPLKVVEQNQIKTTEKALEDTVLTELKAPILFSWSELHHWENLKLCNGASVEYTENCNSNYPLLTKTVFTYYPATLGERINTIKGNNVELFSKDELLQCIKFIRNHSAYFNQFSFKEGTLLFLPLGRGHAASLRELLKDGMLEIGIASSLVFLRKLSKVNINGKLIQKPDLLEVQGLPTVQRDGIEYPTRLLYLKEPLAHQTQLYNFYQFFPIAKTNFGFKYLINSYGYEIDSARQDIQLERLQSKKALEEISAGIQTYIAKLRKENQQPQLIDFAKCLLATDETHLPRKGMIGKLFFENLLDTLAANIPTQKGFADSPDKVRINDTSFKVSPAKLGIKNWDWLHLEFKDYYDLAQTHLNIERVSILKLLKKADRTLLEKWLLELPHEKYCKLLVEMEKCGKRYDDIQDIPFIRCSDNSIHTPKELLEHETKVFLYPPLSGLAKVLTDAGIVHGGAELTHTPQLHRLFPLIPKYYEWFIVEALSSPDINFPRNAKHQILRTLLPIREAQPHVCTQLVIFENAAGQKKPLSKLLKNSAGIAPSGILENYSLKTSEEIPELSNILMQAHEIWQNLVEDWSAQVLPLLPTRYTAVINDLNKLYQTAKTQNEKEKPLPDDYQWLRCQEDEQIYPTNEVYFNPLLTQLNEAEYTDLCNFVQTCTNLKTLRFSDISLLSNIGFAQLLHIKNAEILEHFTADSFTVSHTQLKVLHKIQSGSSFLSAYILQPNSEGEYTISLRGKNKQYYSTNKLLNDYLTRQLNSTISPKYYLLPQELLPIYEQDAQLLREDDNFAQNLINTYGAPHDFIEVIIKRSHNIQEIYLNELAIIELSSFQTFIPEHTAKVISHYCQKDWVGIFREKIRIDGKSLSHYTYNNSVYIKHTESKPSADFKLSLLLPEYQEQGETLESIKTLFRKCNVTYGQLFESKTFPKEKIANHLAQITQFSNTEQLCFMWAYAQSLNGQGNHAHYIPAVSKFVHLLEMELLKAVYEHELPFYTNYPLPPGWFNPKLCIETPDTPLLWETEKIPDDVSNWQRNGDTLKKTAFLINAGLHTASTVILTIRRQLRDNQQTDENHLNQLKALPYFTDTTLLWASQQNWHNQIERDTSRYTTLQKLLADHIIRYGKDYKVALYLATPDKLSTVTLSLRNTNLQPAYIDEKLDAHPENIWLAALTIARKDYAIAEATHYTYTNNVKAYLGTKLTLSTSFAEEQAEKNEWKNDHYEKWKTEDAKDYHIYISTHEIPFTYRLQAGSTVLYEQVHNKGNAQRLDSRERHDIFIYPQQDDVVKFLMEKETELFPSDGNILVKLVRRFYQPPVEIPAPSTFTSTPSNGNGIDVVTGGAGGNGVGKSGDIDVPPDMDKKKAQGLLEKIQTQEMLEKLYENWEEIMKALEKEDRSTPNGLIGFIGEMLAYAYYRTQYPEAKIKYTAKKRREYDIKFANESRVLFFDVKTTIKSIKEEADTVPFYVKASQVAFIDNHPTLPYFIIRISLKNLGLNSWFEKWKKHWKPENYLTIEKAIRRQAFLYFKNPDNLQRFTQQRVAFRLASTRIEKALKDEV